MELSRFIIQFATGNCRFCSNFQVTTEMVRQLSVTAFNLLDALCRNDGLSRSLWNVHRALFASDVNESGQGIGK